MCTLRSPKRQPQNPVKCPRRNTCGERMRADWAKSPSHAAMLLRQISVPVNWSVSWETRVFQQYSGPSFRHCSILVAVSHSCIPPSQHDVASWSTLTLLIVILDSELGLEQSSSRKAPRTSTNHFGRGHARSASKQAGLLDLSIEEKEV
jgi:hypothetical protein